jgi:hypothetical protein
VYKGTHQNRQHRVDFIAPADLASGVETMTPEQTRQCLVDRLKQVEKEILSTTDKARKKELGLLKFDLQTQASAIRPKLRGSRALEHFIIEAAKERMTPALWNLILNEAIRAHKAAIETGDAEP